MRRATWNVDHGLDQPPWPHPRSRCTVLNPGVRSSPGDSRSTPGRSSSTRPPLLAARRRVLHRGGDGRRGRHLRSGAQKPPSRKAARFYLLFLLLSTVTQQHNSEHSATSTFFTFLQSAKTKKSKDQDYEGSEVILLVWSVGLYPIRVKTEYRYKERKMSTETGRASGDPDPDPDIQRASPCCALCGPRPPLRMLAWRACTRWWTSSNGRRREAGRGMA